MVHMCTEYACLETSEVSNCVGLNLQTWLSEYEGGKGFVGSLYFVLAAMTFAWKDLLGSKEFSQHHLHGSFKCFPAFWGEVPGFLKSIPMHRQFLEKRLHTLSLWM